MRMSFIKYLIEEKKFEKEVEEKINQIQNSVLLDEKDFDFKLLRFNYLIANIFRCLAFNVKANLNNIKQSQKSEFIASLEGNNIPLVNRPPYDIQIINNKITKNLSFKINNKEDYTIKFQCAKIEILDFNDVVLCKILFISKLIDDNFNINNTDLNIDDYQYVYSINDGLMCVKNVFNFKDIPLVKEKFNKNTKKQTDIKNPQHTEIINNNDEKEIFINMIDSVGNIKSTLEKNIIAPLQECINNKKIEYNNQNILNIIRQCLFLIFSYYATNKDQMLEVSSKGSRKEELFRMDLNGVTTVNKENKIEFSEDVKTNGKIEITDKIKNQLINESNKLKYQHLRKLSFLFTNADLNIDFTIQQFNYILNTYLKIEQEIFQMNKNGSGKYKSLKVQINGNDFYIVDRNSALKEENIRRKLLFPSELLQTQSDPESNEKSKNLNQTSIQFNINNKESFNSINNIINGNLKNQEYTKVSGILTELLLKCSKKDKNALIIDNKPIKKLTLEEFKNIVNPNNESKPKSNFIGTINLTFEPESNNIEQYNLLNDKDVANIGVAFGEIMGGFILNSIITDATLEYPLQSNAPLYDFILKNKNYKNNIYVSSKYEKGASPSGSTLFGDETNKQTYKDIFTSELNNKKIKKIDSIIDSLFKIYIKTKDKKQKGFLHQKNLIIAAVENINKINDNNSNSKKAFDLIKELKQNNSFNYIYKALEGSNSVIDFLKHKEIQILKTNKTTNEDEIDFNRIEYICLIGNKNKHPLINTRTNKNGYKQQVQQILALKDKISDYKKQNKDGAIYSIQKNIYAIIIYSFISAAVYVIQNTKIFNDILTKIINTQYSDYIQIYLKNISFAKQVIDSISMTFDLYRFKTSDWKFVMPGISQNEIFNNKLCIELQK